MKFKTGDTVSVLNEKAEGVITKVTEANRVLVSIEGMEYTYFTNQLVLSSSPDEKITTEDEDGIFLIFSPVNQTAVIDSDLHVELVNCSSYDVQFVFSLEYENDFMLLTEGKMGSGTIVEICELKRNEIGDWHSVKIDLVFSGNGNHGAIESFSQIIKLKHAKFFKQNSYKEYPFIEGKAVCETVADFNFEEEEIFEEGIKKIISEKDIPSPVKQTVKKSLMFGQTEEVDLHIEELLDDTTGMSASEKLNYQLNVFKKKLDECIMDNRRRIIFIHGAGTGVLRASIRKIMDEEYDNVNYVDASMGRYGVGATEVQILFS